jgi:hypothetical protein
MTPHLEKPPLEPTDDVPTPEDIALEVVFKGTEGDPLLVTIARAAKDFLRSHGRPEQRRP